MTNQEIHDICKKYRIRNYTINSDGSIDVDGNVNLEYNELTKIPIKFNKVRGSFDCSSNNLTSLEGSPERVRGSFDCVSNNLTSLQYSPEIVDGGFYCGGNTLESLDGYNGDYEKLYCDNKDGLILKHKRSKKLKLINEL